MSKLDELIKKYCPNGVPYLCLGEVGQVKMCKRILKSQTNDTSGVPFYKIGTFGKEAQSYISEELYNDCRNRFSYPKKGEILISAAGTIGRTVIYDGQPAYYQDSNIVWLSHDESLVLNTYLNYCYETKPWNISSGGTISRLYNNDLLNTKIPVPPLPVQEEIVRILDSFTSLTAELTAELTARKQQYEYYREMLLTDTTDTPLKKLGDTCNMKSGKAIKAVMLSSEKDEEHGYPCFGGNGIRGYIAESSHHGEYPIIGRQGALCGNVNYATGDFYATEHAVVVKSKGEYDQRYLFYLLTSMNLNQYKSQGAQPGLAVGNIENLMAPVPSLEKQKRIVNVLDRFDMLCEDISSELPAEIEARQKQYEYYRDKLLTFKQLA